MLQCRECSVFYTEDGVWGVGLREDGVEVRAVSVGDEYLSEVRGANQFDDVFHTVGIELVEDIVEQQKWRGCRDGLA